MKVNHAECESRDFLTQPRFTEKLGDY